MARYFIILVMHFFSYCFSPVHAQEILTQLKNAILTGKGHKIMDCLNDESDIYFEGKKTMKRDSVTSKHFNHFFKINPPQSFDYVYKSILRDEKKYVIGSYETKNGDYRVLIRVKKKVDDNSDKNYEIYYFSVSKKEE